MNSATVPNNQPISSFFTVRAGCTHPLEGPVRPAGAREGTRACLLASVSPDTSLGIRGYAQLESDEGTQTERRSNESFTDSPIGVEEPSAHLMASCMAPRLVLGAAFDEP